jgi:hypothetical protein
MVSFCEANFSEVQILDQAVIPDNFESVERLRK